MPGPPGVPGARPGARGSDAAGRGGAAADPRAGGRERVAGLLRRQAGWCEDYGSSLSALLLRAAADDVAAGGPAWGVLEAYADEPGGAALALRFLGGVHRLALTRRAPRLALHLPSVGGTAGPDGAGHALMATVAEHADELRELTARPCQTNEVGRCAALLVGFLAVADETGLPLRLLEIGASAGLNLRWDRYGYRQPDLGWSWGRQDAPLVLSGHWTAPPRPEPAEVAVVERAGCDPRPLDPTSPEGRLTLTSFVWPDQPERLARLRGALAMAAGTPAAVDAEGLATWLPARLAEPRTGVATVVYSSAVAPYLSAAERTAEAAALATAGAGAGGAAPLYRLRFEHDADIGAFALDLWRWPGGEVRRLATANGHGAGVAASSLRA